MFISILRIGWFVLCSIPAMCPMTTCTRLGRPFEKQPVPLFTVFLGGAGLVDSSRVQPSPLGNLNDFTIRRIKLKKHLVNSDDGLVTGDPSKRQAFWLQPIASSLGQNLQQRPAFWLQPIDSSLGQNLQQRPARS